MVFSSNIFLFFFLPIVLLLYRFCPNRLRNGLLLLASLIFYAWGEPVYIFLMLLTILLNYISGRWIERSREQKKKARLVFLLTVILNLASLFYFKYASLFFRSLQALISPLQSFSVPEPALPIGISFYTFQALSYLIDVYRGEVPAQRNVISFGTYIALFPQLIAGPIVQYSDIQDRLENRTVDRELFSDGVVGFLLGLGKKLLIANRMGLLWELLKGEKGALATFFCVIAYTFQIYFDFSGYSDMAIGLGKMFGFRFLPNFDYPYISLSITEFWRRWHISLGQWFRKYVYIPLGGNRKGLKRQLLNILIVWSLSGLWHGAGWNFLIWGVYYAFLLILEKLFFLKAMERAPKSLRHLTTMLLVSYGWLLFSATSFREAADMTAKLFSFGASSGHAVHTILAYLPLLFMAGLLATPMPKQLYLRAYHRMDGRKGQGLLSLLGLLLIFLLCVADLAAQSYNPFIYFRF